MDYTQIKEICIPAQMPLANCPLNNYKRCSSENCPLVNITQKNIVTTIKLRKGIEDIQKIVDNFYCKAIEFDDDYVGKFIDKLQDKIDNINELI